MTLEEAKAGLSQIKQKIFVHENSNDMYCLSEQYREDKIELRFWEDKVKELENDKN